MRQRMHPVGCIDRQRGYERSPAKAQQWRRNAKVRLLATQSMCHCSRMRAVLRAVLSLLLVFFGLLLVMAGQADDSPGLGGIGLIIIAGAVVLYWREPRRRQ